MRPSKLYSDFTQVGRFSDVVECNIKRGEKHLIPVKTLPIDCGCYQGWRLALPNARVFHIDTHGHHCFAGRNLGSSFYFIFTGVKASPVRLKMGKMDQKILRIPPKGDREMSFRFFPGKWRFGGRP